MIMESHHSSHFQGMGNGTYHSGHSSSGSNNTNGRGSKPSLWAAPVSNPAVSVPIIALSSSSSSSSAAVPVEAIEGQVDTDSNNNNVAKAKKKTKKKGPPPVVVNMRDCHYRVLATAAAKCGWGRSVSNPVTTMFDWDIYWTDSGHSIENMVHIAKPYQRINHFPGMNCIYRKHHLAKSMSRMKKINEREYNFFPRTWLLPEDATSIRNYLRAQPKSSKDYYIVKPASSCQVKINCINISCHIFILVGNT
jgi:hypothetical protein